MEVAMEFQATLLPLTLGESDGEYVRHWSPDSELYAPADVLFQYLRLGWTLKRLVAVEVVYYGGYRRSVIYYFTVENQSQFIEIPIIATPPILRLVEEQRLTMVYAWTAPATFSRKFRRRNPSRRYTDVGDSTNSG